MGAGRAAQHSTGAFAACEDMDQEYERRLLRQINHQNLPTEARLSKVTHTHTHTEHLLMFAAACLVRVYTRLQAETGIMVFS